VCKWRQDAAAAFCKKNGLPECVVQPLADHIRENYERAQHEDFSEVRSTWLPSLALFISCCISLPALPLFASSCEKLARACTCLLASGTHINAWHTSKSYGNGHQSLASCEKRVKLLTEIFEHGQNGAAEEEGQQQASQESKDSFRHSAARSSQSEGALEGLRGELRSCSRSVSSEGALPERRERLEMEARRHMAEAAVDTASDGFLTAVEYRSAKSGTA